MVWPSNATPIYISEEQQYGPLFKRVSLVDKAVDVGLCSETCRRKIFDSFAYEATHFFGNGDKGISARFVKASLCRGRPWSPPVEAAPSHILWRSRTRSGAQETLCSAAPSDPMVNVSLGASCLHGTVRLSDHLLPRTVSEHTLPMDEEMALSLEENSEAWFARGL